MDVPKLLVKSEPIGRSLASSLAVMLTRYPRVPATASIPYGAPLRYPIISLCFHFAALAIWILLSPWLFLELSRLNPPLISPIWGKDFIVQKIDYLGRTLPQTTDVSGASMGRQGRSGGQQYFHPEQIIHVARDKKVAPVIAAAPPLMLPHTNEPVANLLRFLPSSPMPAVRYADTSATPVILAKAVPPLEPPVRPRFLPKQEAPLTPPPLHVTDLSLRAKLTMPVTVPSLPDLEPTPLEPPARPRFLPKREAPMIPPPLQITDSSLHAKLNMPVGQIAMPSLSDPEPITKQIHGSAPADLPSEDRLAASPPENSNAGSPGYPGFGGPNTSAAVVISVDPGNTPGLPVAGGGALAMSPSGHGGGAGGRGGGTGVGTGSGAGSGIKDTGPGAGDIGVGFGADPVAVGGTSPAPGPGGAGSVGGNAPNFPGVAIAGGTVHLPSFGPGAGGPTLPKRLPAGSGKSPAIMVIASPRAGGALNNYGEMKGGRVYTMYLDTRTGSIVLQFSDPVVKNDLEYDLIPPEPLMTDIPSGILLPHTLLACVLERNGTLRAFRVLRTPNPDRIQPLIRALERWRFVPVVRGKERIAVDVMLGFGVSTVD
jgi:hypothetical protein